MKKWTYCIYELIQKQDISLYKLTQELELMYPNVAKIANNRVKQVGTETLEKLVNHLDVEASELIRLLPERIYEVRNKLIDLGVGVLKTTRQPLTKEDIQVKFQKWAEEENLLGEWDEIIAEIKEYNKFDDFFWLEYVEKVKR